MFYSMGSIGRTDLPGRDQRFQELIDSIEKKLSL